ncbi:uncharacterized protein LY89DRAFT_747417 [Mollisia scopiformis]|uniref:CPAF-like PDZ domain-containing protein n=1 Tax=Mollisia scopiformis TaxID=149040 RepID=A0A194XBZ6_MOLSC|nr:uncharacterized protein LY89DRAFT_747417 [Mollisia scopiformis]KUJ17685.1 hypothetical protein LY89DRAFT_747417 [Mollisia scopiformis]
MKSFSLLCLSLLASTSSALPATSTSAAPAQSTACGTIVNDPDTYVFNASLAYECLTSVPFNPAVATRFLAYYNDTLQFQSTLAYLRNPPTSYQQPGVDLLLGLQNLQDGINNGIFPNQYEFEAALQTLLYATHDAHVNLFAGILSAFTFASPYDIVSLSIDGIQLPKVYFAFDLFESKYFTTYQPSAIKTINGVNATTYLMEFASKNSIGTLEKNADWNQLMLSAALDIQGYFDVFSGGATFYPGDTITTVLENGTTYTDNFQAVYNDPGPTGPLETGGDFYNFFVLGFYPASFNESDDSTGSSSVVPSATATATSTVVSSAAATPSNWNNTAYPDTPDVVQTDLGTYGGGYISGYFLNSTSISVLSIPSFDEYDAALNTFQSTISDFITRSKAAGLQKVVIDLQQNTGGQPLLAIDTFKQFFPNIDPFDGSRMRAHPSADVMGNTITGYFQSLNTTDEDYYALIGDEWVATDLINANTNQNFTSWAEFFGPHLYNGDNFTTVQRYNLSSILFDDAATNTNFSFAVYGYGANPAPANASPPWAAEDIVLLSDGICDSSCALFMEMMHHEAGVRVVAAGGLPTTGPMQAPSGSRGASDYDVSILDANIDFAQQILQSDNSPEQNFLPNRTTAMDVFVTYADINLRDQVRRNETIPLQFAYEAADCRIFYTPKTIYNYTALWQYTADAIWSTPSLCVQGSTGFATTGTNTTDFVGPSSSSAGARTNISDYLAALNSSSISSLTYLNDGLEDGFALQRYKNTVVTSCTIESAAACTGGTICDSGVCKLECVVGNAKCAGGQPCQARSNAGVSVGSQALLKGVCPVSNSKVTTKTSPGPLVD